MTRSSSNNPLENTLRDSIARVSSANLEEKSGNHSVNKKNIDNSLDANDRVKKTPPSPKIIKDEFGTKAIPEVEFDSKAAEFITANQDLSKSNYDPFQKTNNNYSSLSPEEIAKRTDVLNSLDIMEEEREAENPFKVESSAVYDNGEASHVDFLGSDKQDAVGQLEQENNIKKAINDSYLLDR